MINQVGYKLKVIETGEVIDQWGGVWGQSPGVPSEIKLPSGDIVCAPTVGENYQGCILEIWEMEQPILIPQIISDRQFFQQAAIDGIITQAEALAAVKTGDIPVVLQAIVDAIPDEMQKFAAVMLLSGATTFTRDHPLTETVGQALGWSSIQIDNFFLSAALL